MFGVEYLAENSSRFRNLLRYISEMYIFSRQFRNKFIFKFLESDIIFLYILERKIQVVSERILYF